MSELQYRGIPEVMQYEVPNLAQEIDWEKEGERFNADETGLRYAMKEVQPPKNLTDRIFSHLSFLYYAKAGKHGSITSFLRFDNQEERKESTIGELTHLLRLAEHFAPESVHTPALRERVIEMIAKEQEEHEKKIAALSRLRQFLTYTS